MNTPAPMPDSGFPLHLDALVAQREFVRRLARSLLRDDFAADDVAQDVMLSALERPQLEVRSVRGFLATLTRRRVANARRSEERRVEHESRTARAAESDEADVRRSLETAQEIAAEVLALDEPYRGVLLLLYLQGESPAAIAERRGTTPATVRSQHKRALELLRERLDRRHGGRREMWSASLAPALAAPKSSASLAVPVAIAAAVVIALSTVVWFAPWRVPTRVEDGHAALAAGAQPAPRAELAQPAAAELAAVAIATDPARQSASASDAFDFTGGSTAELLDLAAAAQSILRERLLKVPAEIAARAPAIPAGARGGVARILERTAFGPTRPNVVGIRGGAANFSFTLNSHSYDREPQIALEQGILSSGFAGNDVGLVVDFGNVALDDLLHGGAKLDGALAAEWNLLARDIDARDADARRALKAELRARRVTNGPRARVGRTYLVRSISDGSCDILAAFHVLAADDEGITFAWRFLREWPLIDSQANTHAEVWAPAPASVPDWLARLSTEELVAGVRRLTFHVRDQLLAVPGATAADSRTKGQARLLRGWTLGWLLPSFHDGSNYSFVTRSHDYEEEPDIALDATWTLDSGFYGGCEGFVVDLGPQPLESLALDAGSPPVTSSPLARHAWKELWELQALQPTVADPRPRALSQSERERMLALQIDRARAVVGHTYLVRSILPQEHDVLVAFEVTAIDDYGCTIRWKLLKRW